MSGETSLDDLLKLSDGGPTPEKKSLYEKQGDKPYSSRDALDAVEREMGDQQLRDRFGFIPISILKFDRNPQMMTALDDTSEVRKPLRGTIGGGYATKLRYSMYNLDAAKFFLDYYLPPKARVLDPFMGRGTRALAAFLLGMTYVGFDTCDETIGVNQTLLKRHTENLPPGWQFHLGDGTELDPYRSDKNTFDGVFSCPPYYDTEEYSGATGDLSRMSDKDFEAAIDRMFRHLYRLVKPSGKLRPDLHPVVLTVGTVRRGELGLLDMDCRFQVSAAKAGFLLHDKVITQNIAPGAGFTFRRNFGGGYVCKAHETTLVFVKRG